jgi:hypothetical protein
MAIDTVILLLSLLSFAALIAIWISAPLAVEETAPVAAAAEPAAS